MRTAFAVFAIFLLLYQANPSSAQTQPGDTPPPSGDPAPDPEAWTMPPEGTRHVASGTLCRASVDGFARMEFSGPASPNVLGLCVYIDETGTGDAGIRVRRYLPGIGSSRDEIQNDRALMEPGPEGAPLFAVRMDGAATRDGKNGGRVTITKVRNGFLVDCYGEGATLEVASAKLALVCGN